MHMPEYKRKGLVRKSDHLTNEQLTEYIANMQEVLQSVLSSPDTQEDTALKSQDTQQVAEVEEAQTGSKTMLIQGTSLQTDKLSKPELRIASMVTIKRKSIICSKGWQQEFPKTMTWLKILRMLKNNYNYKLKQSKDWKKLHGQNWQLALSVTDQPQRFIDEQAKMRSSRYTVASKKPDITTSISEIEPAETVSDYYGPAPIGLLAVKGKNITPQNGKRREGNRCIYSRDTRYFVANGPGRLKAVLVQLEVNLFEADLDQYEEKKKKKEQMSKTD
ncbi:hypothetical protein K440DRAFT_637357 [Wilcoxina mikolae CBS 423.85]|nr:hypothetical protein K440DRAFT_637357 [Wilcoxina mikolae CBS 423.85]